MMTEDQVRALLARYTIELADARTETARTQARAAIDALGHVLAETPSSVTVKFSDTPPFTWPSDVPDPTRTSLTDGRFDRDTDEE